MAAELEQKRQNWIESVRQYLGDIRSEMKRVTWPNRDQVQATTAVVIIAVFIFAVYFKVVDQIIQETIVRADQYLVK
jgi:preprotein translocase subunit SecE